jgi:Flp pilus assembly protein TadD
MLRRLAVVALLAFPAFAAEKDHWIHVSSPSFELYTTAGERAGRDLVRHFEQVHSFFVQRFGMAADLARKGRIILFRTEKEYEPYRPNEFASAFYHPGEYHDFIVMSSSAAESRPVAVHELTHMMVHQLGVDLPPWLNEGLAELYSNLEPRGAQIMVGRDIPGRMRTLATERWIDLRTLLAVDQNSPYYNERSRAGMFYAESWKLVHMLHLHPEYQRRFGDLVRALHEGDPESAFRTAYGKSLDEVQRDLQEYLSGGTIRAMLFDIPLPKAVEDPHIEPGAALPARLAIAEMLSNTRGRLAQAHEAYDSIAHDYPGKWEAEEALGMLAWHERKLEEANRHFAKAEELGCRDGSMFLLWGRVLGYSQHTAEAVRVLKKAADLAPESDEARLEYGNALMLNGDWSGTVAVLRSVRSVPPAGRWRYYYNLAYALYGVGETAAARGDLARARQYASSSRETASLDQLAAALDRNEPATFPSVEGALVSVECGKLAQLHVRVDGSIRIFVIPDLRGIKVMSADGKRVDLPCGAQENPPAVRIGYQSLPGGNGAAGLVRTLEFR